MIGMKIRLRIGMAAARASVRPGRVSFYDDNDSLGPRTALILAILQHDSSFVTSQPPQRGVRWIQATMLNNHHRQAM